MAKDGWMDGWMDGWQFYRKTSGRTDVGYFSRWTCFKLESIASGFFAASLCMMRHGMCSFCNKFNNLTYLHLLILLGSQAGVWTWKSQPFVGEKPATPPGVSTWEGSDFDHRERGAKRVTRHFFGFFGKMKHVFFWCLPWDFAIYWAWVGPHSDSDSWNESASDVTPALISVAIWWHLHFGIPDPYCIHIMIYHVYI